jgi:hypothetical protein
MVVYEPGAVKRRQGHALRGGGDPRLHTRPDVELAPHSAAARAEHSSQPGWGALSSPPWTHPVR